MDGPENEPMAKKNQIFTFEFCEKLYGQKNEKDCLLYYLSE
jgi:hypothetical protein